MRLENLQALWYFWLLPPMLLLGIWSVYRRRRLLGRFAQSPLLPHLMPDASAPRLWAKIIFFFLALVFLIFTLTQPAWNPTPKQVQRQGRDIVILLDVSRSMLAQDLRPNRLERAKLAVNDLLGHLQGDRIVIIAFAGTPALKCPLTHDYGFARLALHDIDIDSAGRGGTHIGDAIRMAATQVFDDQQRDYKDIILITDGEDHESLPLEAAQAAAGQGIRIFAIGLGSETEGARIPVTDSSGRQSFLKYQNQEVWTKLDAETLKQIVFATPGGKYLNVATGSFDITQVYDDLIAGAARQSYETVSTMLYQQKFQIFLFAAIILLICEVWIRERQNEKTV